MGVAFGGEIASVRIGHSETGFRIALAAVAFPCGFRLTTEAVVLLPIADKFLTLQSLTVPALRAKVEQ